MKKILVVDNDPILLKLMTRLLEKEGHQVTVAEDGLQALDVMKAYTPDIIFVDLIMPIIDGKMLCKIIGGIEKLKDVRVIILSAIAAEERTDFSQLGVYASIAKGPFNITGQHVIDVIHQIEHEPVAVPSKETIGVDDVYARGITRELLVANRHFEMILDKMSEGVVGVNSEGRIIYANLSFFSLLGLSGVELYGSYFLDLFTDSDRLRVTKLLNNNDGKSHAITENSPICLNEHLVTLDFLPFKEHGFSRIIINDVTERKRAEEALRLDKEKFRILVEESPLGISLINSSGHYKYINPRFIEMFGYTLADIPTGAKWFANAYPLKDYRDQAISNWINDHKKTGPERSRQRIFTVRCKDGSDKLILFRPTRLENSDQFIIYEDITEQNRLEAQLRQAQKMEAIGTLAGGIAHDFNNLMMAILGNVSLMLFETDSSDPDYNRLKTIENQIKKGTKLTEQLLGFARKGKYYIKTVNINQLLKDTLNTFGRTRKEIRHQFDLAENLFVIDADEGQIEQVVLNLYVNAADAMPQGGDLFLKTRNVTHREIPKRSFIPLPGNYVFMQFIDTGVGIDKKIQKRIFDPFFTTKEMGRGTGLGLASVYGIIKGHGGYIDVESEGRQGTTFNIYLPASDKKTEKKAEASAQVMTGSETILLVEDEEIVLKVNMEMLKSFGYSVLEARNGDDAIKIFRENKHVIDLVVLDMILPGMSGGQVYDKIKDVRPDVKVLLSSGYSIDGQARKILERGCDDFIQKPYNLKDFSLKIRKILDHHKFP